MSTVTSTSQPIGDIVNYTTGQSVLMIDGTEWTGPVLTVGADKMYATMQAAVVAANASGVACMILVDAGTYAGWSTPPTYTVYVRGLGATANDTVVGGLSGNDVFLENIYIYADVVYGYDGALYTAHGIVNKCRIGSGAYPGSGTIWPLYYQGTLPPYRTLYLSYTRLDRTPAGAYAAHIEDANLSCISLSKVSYTSTWIERRCTGTLILDDKDADGQAGYGPTYGSFRITVPGKYSTPPSTTDAEGIFVIRDETLSVASGMREFRSISAAEALDQLGLDRDLATFSLPANTTISTFGASIVDDASAAAVIATLGLDADLATFALPASTTISAYGASLIDDAAATNARDTLELGSSNSPVFVTVKLSGLTDGYMPVHTSDAVGLENGPVKTDVDSAVSLKHAAVTVSAPISMTGQALSLVNDVTGTITEIDTGALANSDTKVPTSKAVYTAVVAVAPHEPLVYGASLTPPEFMTYDGDILMAKM